MNNTDPQDTQPDAGSPKEKHRHYVPATWAAPGAGAGHPKLAGGYEVDSRSGAIAPRGMNRTGQRYTQAAAVIDANRVSRATLELPTTSILWGSFPGIEPPDNLIAHLWEVRGLSGNQYDVNLDVSGCDCPDWRRLMESGYLTSLCKHQIMVNMYIASIAGIRNPLWAISLLAANLGIAERTAESLCADGAFVATKVNGVWHIDMDTPTNIANLATYRHKIWPYL